MQIAVKYRDRLRNLFFEAANCVMSNSLMRLQGNLKLITTGSEKVKDVSSAR